MKFYRGRSSEAFRRSHLRTEVRPPKAHLRKMIGHPTLIQMPAIIQKLNKNYLALAVFAALIILFYGNTLQNGFVHDDFPIMANNVYVHSFEYLPKVVTGCTWEYVLGTCEGSTLHYRPMQTLSYLLTWQISSAPWFFHLVTISYFFIVVVLVFFFAKTLSNNFNLAFLAALIFLIHPLQSEVANWIASTQEPLMAIFTLLSLIVYVKYRRENSNKHFILALLFYFLAMLSKETAAFVLPPIVLSLDIFFFKKNIKDILKPDEIKRYLFFAAPFLLYFLMRQAVLGGLGGAAFSKDYFGVSSVAEKVYYFLWLFAFYIKALFYPEAAAFLKTVPEVYSLSNLDFGIIAMVFLLYSSLIYFAARLKKNFFAFSLLWFFLWILPTLLFYFVIAGVFFAKRYMFLPNIGFAMGAAYLISCLWSANLSPVLKRVVKILILFAISTAIFVSWQIVYSQNKNWKDSVTLLRSDLAINPNANLARGYLAEILRGQGDFEGAKKEMEEILERDPESQLASRISGKLGQYYQAKKDTDRALEYFEKALIFGAASFQDYQNYNNLGKIYAEKENYLKSLIYFCQAFQAAPQSPELQENFNRVASTIASVGSENFIILYMDLMDGKKFKKSTEEKIKFKNKTCSGSDCFYVFFPELEKGDVIFPFLIVAKAFPEELFQIESSDYNPSANEITLKADPQFKDRAVIFIFPTCKGVYYETNVPLAPQTFSPSPNLPINIP